MTEKDNAIVPLLECNISADTNKAEKEEWFVQKSCCEDEVTLKFDDDTELYVSAGFLIYASPVFRAMLTSDFAEKKNKIVNLPGKRYDDMLMFLKCMHPGFFLRITSANVAIIAALAEEYQVDTIITKCKEVLTIWLRRGHDFHDQDLLVKVPDKHPHDPRSEFNVVSSPIQFAPVSNRRNKGGFTFGSQVSSPSHEDKCFLKDVNICLKVMLMALERNYTSIKLEAVSILSGIPFKYTNGKCTLNDQTSDIVSANQEMFQKLPQDLKLEICQKRLWVCDN